MANVKHFATSDDQHGVPHACMHIAALEIAWLLTCDHFAGSGRVLPFCSARRARLGVSSGRSATRRPPLSYGSRRFLCH